MNDGYCNQCSKLRSELKRRFGNAVVFLDGWKFSCRDSNAFRDFCLEFDDKPRVTVLAAHPSLGFDILLGEFRISVDKCDKRRMPIDQLDVLLASLECIRSDNVAIKVRDPDHGTVIILPTKGGPVVVGGVERSIADVFKPLRFSDWELSRVVPNDVPPFPPPRPTRKRRLFRWRNGNP